MPQPPSQATQAFVPIREVRDGIVILKDGSLRALLLASSINLALKSADEQTAVLAQFQNFLNSVEFSLQFFVESRQLDIRPYIATLEARYGEQTEDLLKIQIREYITFIRDFTQRVNIMSKSFFVVVPYDPPLIASKDGLLGRVLGKIGGAEESGANFEQYRSQLEQRIGVVEQGLARSGVRVAQLGTEEAIELFTKLFNPGELEKPIALGNQALGTRQ